MRNGRHRVSDQAFSVPELRLKNVVALAVSQVPHRRDAVPLAECYDVEPRTCFSSTMHHLHAWLDGSERTGETSVAGTAVDRLAEKVHVAEMAGVLLDEVGQDPT